MAGNSIEMVSLIFPAYNEEKHVAQAVREFASIGLIDEILVVDNNSTDRTAELARQAGATVILETRQGFGSALRRGLREAKGEIIFLAEPDGTFVAGDVKKFLAYAGEFDLVLGTRTSKELIWTGANMSWFLRMGNVAVARMVEVLFSGCNLTDCGCTFRVIRRPALNRLGPYLTVEGSHFLPEMVMLSLLMGLKMIEIPINYKPRIGTSKITGTLKGTLTTGFRMIGLILLYRLKTWLGWRPWNQG